MRSRILNQNGGTKGNRPLLIPRKRHPIELTALVYLKEALEEKRYEELKEIIDIGREFGISNEEIQRLFTLK